MDFKKYSEIENTYRVKILDNIRNHGYDIPDITWTVTEKVDGSNLSFWIRKGVITPARRTAFLEPDENFYNYQTVLEKYRDKFIKAAARFPSSTVIIYGELFGGSYKHPDVPKDPDAKKVQDRIQYCPHNDFYVFDVYIMNKERDLNSYYLPHNVVGLLCEAEGFLYAKSIFTGTFDECLKFDNRFITTIPAIFDLPPIENNYAEGVVIKPNDPLYFKNGDRVILKNKIEEFAEITKIPKEKEPLLPEVTSAIGRLSDYITESRYYSVISKLGEVTIKDFSYVMKEYTSDLMKDFIKDYPEYVELPKEVQKQITKAVGKSAAAIIRRLL